MRNCANIDTTATLHRCQTVWTHSNVDSGRYASQQQVSCWIRNRTWYEVPHLVQVLLYELTLKSLQLKPEPLIIIVDYFDCFPTLKTNRHECFAWHVEWILAKLVRGARVDVSDNLADCTIWFNVNEGKKINTGAQARVSCVGTPKSRPC